METSPELASRFSRRTAWNRAPSELQQGFAASSKGLPLLDLTLSNPTACGFVLPALEALMEPGALFYQPDPKGLRSARESIATYYAGHGAVVSSEQVVLTASSSESYSHLFRLLCEQGDEILIAQPSYPLLTFLADLSDVTLRSYPLFYDHGWWTDFAELERVISKRTRAIVLIHPNNPTGHPTSTSERERLFDLCRRHGLMLIVDEVFLDYPHQGFPVLQSFAASSLPPLMFVLSGLSKIAALPQMKIGWILVCGPDAERIEALARLEFIADIFLSVNTPSQLALTDWLVRAPSVQQQIIDRISLNSSLLADSKLDFYEIAAGWTAIGRLPKIFDNETAFETLRDLNIVTHPAHFYGLEDPNRVVLSLITPTDILRLAMERIGQLLSQLST